MEKIGISKKQAKLTLDELNALVVRELKKEGSIRLAGLSIFRKRKLKARMGRGRDRVQMHAYLVAAAYNRIRIAKLSPAPA